MVQYYYDAFGVPLEGSESINNPFRYAGYIYDKETGMYYLNARYYNPVTARFITEDTYRGTANDPLSLNLYTYCVNNPLIYFDPTGHWPDWVAIGGAIKQGVQDLKNLGTSVVNSAKDLGTTVENTAKKAYNYVKKKANSALKAIDKNISDTSNIIKAHKKETTVASEFAEKKVIADNFIKGVWDAGKETVIGVINSIVPPIQSYNNIKYAVTHKAEIFNAIKDEVVNVENDIINGAPDKSAYAVGKLAGGVLLSALGTKGVDKVSKVLKGIGKAENVVKISNKVDDVGNFGANNTANGAKLKTFYQQAEKYGTGAIKDLPDGRIRFYGGVKTAIKEGKMAGGRLVREWNQDTGAKRTWIETIDHSGNIRQVRPEIGGVKTHYTFDANGNYTGSWAP